MKEKLERFLKELSWRKKRWQLVEKDPRGSKESQVKKEPQQGSQTVGPLVRSRYETRTKFVKIS